MKKYFLFLSIGFLISACGFDPQNFFSKKQDAEFPGGKMMLNRFLANNLAYPQEAVEMEIEGKVYVRFAIEKTGQISHVQVVKHSHDLLDKEAVRVVKKMPRWNPGKINGKPIVSYFNLPVTFKLQ